MAAGVFSIQPLPTEVVPMNKLYELIKAGIRALMRPLSDESFSKIQFLYKQKRLPDLLNPKTLNEKLQWLKLNYRDPIIPICADKYAVREHLENLGLQNYLIPLITTIRSNEEIQFDKLPNRFVAKAAHSSGWNILCKDKTTLDRRRFEQSLYTWLQTNFYEIGREWIYKDISPKIVVEEFIETAAGESPWDYKFFCFHGEPKFIQVDYSRFSNHTRNLFDLKWNLLPCSLEYPNSDNVSDPPTNLQEMIQLAGKLSEDFPFVRVDLYDVDEKVYFGELTFCPGKACERFRPTSWDYTLGEYLNLPLARTSIK